MNEILNLINRYKAKEFDKYKLYELVNEAIQPTDNFREIEKIVLKSKVDCKDPLLIDLLENKLSEYEEYYEEAEGVTQFLPQLYFEEVMSRNFSEYQIEKLMYLMGDTCNEFELYPSWLNCDIEYLIQYVKDNPIKMRSNYRTPNPDSLAESMDDFD